MVWLAEVVKHQFGPDEFRHYVVSYKARHSRSIPLKVGGTSYDPSGGGTDHAAEEDCGWAGG